MDELFLQENDSVEITKVNDDIVIKKAARIRRAKKSLDERFDNYAGEFKCYEYDWGKPVGKEDW